ncbi:hypothetical protein C7S17_2033 [Burkholderia thailandensis]|nr:hypothetical protein [Burkholderia thailandensis]
MITNHQDATFIDVDQRVRSRHKPSKYKAHKEIRHLLTLT